MNTPRNGHTRGTGPVRPGDLTGQRFAQNQARIEAEKRVREIRPLILRQSVIRHTRPGVKLAFQKALGGYKTITTFSSLKTKTRPSELPMNEEYATSLADQKRSLTNLLNMRHECSRKMARLQREMDSLTKLIDSLSDQIDCYEDSMD